MSEPDWKSKKVLVVDNDAEFVTLAKTALSGAGVSEVNTSIQFPMP
jgi:CheY-like chemotaxis protein